MKKIISLVLVLFIISISAIPAFAATVKVSALDTLLSEQESAVIPVSTSGNTGIMGFKMQAKFNPDILEVLSVSKGELTAKGSFNSKIDTNKGVVTIIWNHTAQIEGDGSLFVLAVRAKKNFKTQTIALSFSQADTFNESFEDVALNCSSITLSMKSTEESTTRQQEQETQTTAGLQTTTAPAASSDPTLTAIDLALSDSGYQSITQVEQKDYGFLDKANQNMFTLTGKSGQFASLDDVKQAYNKAVSNDYANTVTGLLPYEQVQSAFKTACKKNGVRSLEELKNDAQKKKFVEDFEKALASFSDTISPLSGKVDSQAALNAVRELMQKNAEIEKTTATPSSGISFGSVVIISIAALAVVAGAVIAIVLIRKKRKI